MKRFKEKVFAFGSEQLKQLMVNQFFFAVVWLIGLVQAQAIPFCSFYKEFSDSSYAEWICKVSKYSMLIISDEIITSKIIIITAGFIACFYIITIALMPDKLIGFIPSYISSILVKICGVCTLCVAYILVRPIQYFLMNLYLCNNINNCFSVSHSIWLGIGILMQILFIALGIVLLIIFRESCPESHLLWAVFNGILQPVQLLDRISMGASLSIGFKWDLLEPLSIVPAILSGILLIVRWKEGGEHKEWVNGISLYQELLTFTASVGAFIIYLVGNYELIMYISMIMSLPLFVTFNFFRFWDEERIIQTLLPSEQKSTNDIELYIERFIRYLRNPVDGNNYMKMTSVLNLHILHCENPDCICNKLAKFVYDKRKSLKNDAISKIANSKLEGEFEKSYSEFKQAWAKFLILIVNGSLTTFPKVAALHLQLSYLYLKLLSNYYMSFWSVKNAMSCGPSVFLRFQIFRQCSVIEEMIEKTIESTNINEISINVEKKIRFTDQFNKFIEIAESCITNHLQFWETLRESKPNMNKLTYHGEKIGKEFVVIREIYKEMLLLNPTNTSFFIKYAQFLKNVLHDDVEAAAISAKIIYDNEIISKYKRNSWEKESGLMKISGDLKSLGQIRDVNFDCGSLLGYQAKNLIGMNIKRLMPSPIADVHDKWIEHFYDTMHSKVVSRKFLSLVSCENGYYNLFEMFLTPSKHLKDNTLEFLLLFRRTNMYDRIASNLTEDQRQPAMFMCDKNFNIIGLGGYCKLYFDLPSRISDTVNYECSLSDLLGPAVAIKDLFAEGKSLELCQSTISQKLSDGYYKEEDEKDSSLPPDNTKYWVRMVKKVYGECSNSPTALYLFLLIPSLDNNKSLPKLGSPRKLLKEPQDNNSRIPCSESIISNTSSENRDIRNFKLNFYDQKTPLVISLLRYTMLILSFIIFLAEGNFPLDELVVCFILIKVEESKLTTSFQFMTRTTEQYYHTINMGFTMRLLIIMAKYFFKQK